MAINTFTQNISATKLTKHPAKDVGRWNHPKRLNHGCRILVTSRGLLSQSQLQLRRGLPEPFHYRPEPVRRFRLDTHSIIDGVAIHWLQPKVSFGCLHRYMSKQKL